MTYTLKLSFTEMCNANIYVSVDHDTGYVSSLMRQEISDWLLENMQDGQLMIEKSNEGDFYNFRFNSVEDAMAFKLRWL